MKIQYIDCDNLMSISEIAIEIGKTNIINIESLRVNLGTNYRIWYWGYKVDPQELRPHIPKNPGKPRPMTRGGN